MVISGMMALTVAESAATIVGKVWGKNHFRTRKLRHKPFEGSAVMFGVSFGAIFVTNLLFARIPGVWFVPWCLIGALLCAVVATVAELYSTGRLARFTVPLLTAFTSYYYTVAGFR